ncbi:fumarate reductase/succinate dehydrogenase flavoprotein subunit [Acidihalobacter prosperus]
MSNSTSPVETLDTDVLVIGGGTAGPMAAVSSKERNPELRVTLLEKANVKRSGAISMGMDGLNNAVIPGHATPEQYVKEITIANDGIVNQKTVMAYAKRSFDMINKLDSWGVKFEKDETGDYSVKKVHHMGTYVLPMPEGHHMKKILYRQLRRKRVDVVNRYVVTRLLKDASGRIAGAMMVNSRTAEIAIIRAKAVILATGAAGRLGLPASGYLFGTYENPTNAGDGYSMAYQAGAELSGIECYQINPLIKDYNGPACAYVTGPLGGYTANSKGDRFIECDYWSGQMMLEFYRELEGGKGPVFLKLDHLADETIQEIETILHSNERPSRGRFHERRGTNYRERMVEMHISEIGLCSGHSASGVWVNEKAETTVPGLYAAGDMASVPHNYMIGAFVYGRIAGENAMDYVQGLEHVEPDPEFLKAEQTRIYQPLNQPNGVPHTQVEYKLRRLVNDYLQPPKSPNKMDIGLQKFVAYEETLQMMGARAPVQYC